MAEIKPNGKLAEIFSIDFKFVRNIEGLKLNLKSCSCTQKKLITVLASSTKCHNVKMFQISDKLA